MTTRYENTPTVVVVLVPIGGGLLAVRRALPGPGQGQVALPGGYQMLGQTWQEAGVREVLEETGVGIEAGALRLLTVVTTPDTRQNLLFCESPPVRHEGDFAHDAEVSEVLVLTGPVETAFPAHTAMVAAFFQVGRVGTAPETDSRAVQTSRDPGARRSAKKSRSSAAASDSRKPP